MSQVASRVRRALVIALAAYGNTGYAAHAVCIRKAPADGVVGIGLTCKSVCGKSVRLAGKEFEGGEGLELWTEVPERVRCARCWRVLAPRGPKPPQIPGRKRGW